MHWVCVARDLGMVGVLTAAFAGCEKPVAPSLNPALTPPPPRRAEESGGNPTYHLNQAQPKLPAIRLWVGTKSIAAEVCRSITEISTGLMFRPGIGPDEGMLFLFARPHQASFYMKNVGFDIAAAYMDSEGVIQEIVQLKAQDITPVPAKTPNVQFVLETDPGWFQRNGIGPGMSIGTDNGTLKATFKIP